MVGRLVEQHHVGPHQQDARQRHAHLPAAGELADIAVHHLLAETQARQHLAGARLQGIAVQLFEARLHLAIARDDRVHLIGALRVGHRVLQLLQLVRDTALTAPAPSITSATALRPDISPTSWLK